MSRQALDEDDLKSAFLELVHEDRGNEFYFGNDTADLKSAAVTKLGMLCGCSPISLT